MSCVKYYVSNALIMSIYFSEHQRGSNIRGIDSTENESWCNGGASGKSFYLSISFDYF